MGNIQRTDALPAGIVGLFRDSLVWDNHGCMPLRADDERFLPQLQRYRAAGVDAVSVNVGFDAIPWDMTLQVLEHFRTWLAARPNDYILARTAQDIERARATARLAVVFDIEGGSALNAELHRVCEYYELGVRWMLIAYNRNNLLGGGCQDDDPGLLPFGRQVLDEMQRVGMVPCCSHTGFRTTMDVMHYARGPVIFSHSNPLGVWRHRRNIRDEAIKACAATGGVVGINGIGLFLGANDSRPATMARHIDYVAQLVGPKHVGISLDYVFDQQELQDFVTANPETFPSDEYGDGAVALVQPEQLPLVAVELTKLGYGVEDLQAILGGNHLRIAREVWH
jgi:membrane dipeptidase